MSLHKFRINPPKPYAERMTETRADVRRIVRDQLCRSLPPAAVPPLHF